ncbi:hypothetical protein [Rhodococcus spelaei]|nr:hypothetical protein [Rhodococcus spelaei]
MANLGSSNIPGTVNGTTAGIADIINVTAKALSSIVNNISLS